MPDVLLVYANPAITATPVPPYGLERVAASFVCAGCRVRVVSPFVEDDPVADLRAALARPTDLVGFSVRNVDDALVVRDSHGPGDLDTTFHLDAVRPLIAAAIDTVGEDRVVVGGAAVASGPRPVLRFLGARWGVVGAGEPAAARIAAAIGEGRPWFADPQVIDARADAPRPHRTVIPDVAWRDVAFPAAPRSATWLRLAVARDARVAVSLSAGCDRRCTFCVEARFHGRRVVPRPVDDVVAELELLARAGLRRFWLVASELNVPNDRHAIAVFRRLAGRGWDVRGFLQPAPVSDALLDAMEDAGVDPQGLSFELGHLDDGLLRRGAGPANLGRIDHLVETWLRRGYRTLGGSVLLGAHPDETDATVASACDKALDIDAALPDGLGLAYACGARVYPETGLADWIAEHRDAARPHLYGAVDDDSFARVVVFCRPTAPRRLLAWVRDRLAGARGAMGPMNAEAPAEPRRLRAEALINRGLWRLCEDRPADAAEALRDALRHVPDHPEALRQLALVLANRLGDPAGAADALTRLLATLPAADPRRRDIVAALAALGATAAM